MSLASSLESWQKIDFNDLDLNNLGSAGSGQVHRLRTGDGCGTGARVTT